LLKCVETGPILRRVSLLENKEEHENNENYQKRDSDPASDFHSPLYVNLAMRSAASDASDMIVMPGFVDTHYHMWSTLGRNFTADGGFGYSGETSNLETSYRITRSLHMLKAKPADPDRVRAFIAKCRNADAGYGVAPGLLSSASGTYFAAIILHWLDEE